MSPPPNYLEGTIPRCPPKSPPMDEMQVIVVDGLLHHHVLATPCDSQLYEERSLSVATLRRRVGGDISQHHGIWVSRTHPEIRTHGVVELAVNLCHVTGCHPCWATVFCDWAPEGKGRYAECFGVTIPQYAGKFDDVKQGLDLDLDS